MKSYPAETVLSVRYDEKCLAEHFCPPKRKFENATTSINYTKYYCIDNNNKNIKELIVFLSVNLQYILLKTSSGQNIKKIKVETE